MRIPRGEGVESRTTAEDGKIPATPGRRTLSKSNRGPPAASFLARSGRNSPRKRLGGIGVRWRARKRSRACSAREIEGDLRAGRGSAGRPGSRIQGVSEEDRTAGSRTCGRSAKRVGAGRHH